MNTQEFLSLVLPAGDHYFVAIVPPKNSGPVKHFHAASASEAAAKVIAAQRKSTEYNVYYSMASYKEAAYVDTAGKKRKRTQDNVSRLKSFWVDLDCKGKNDGTDYADQKEAVKDLVRFCSETKLPLPTVVNSGYGIHAYWVLDTCITRDEWVSVANRFKITLDAHKVRHDASCTTDCARILRPVGTTNNKEGKPPREVRVIGTAKPVISLKTFSDSLSAELPAGFGAVSSFVFAGVDMTMNIEGEAAVEYRPSSIKEIIKECALTKGLAKLQGNVNYGTWFASLGLVKHTIEGAQAIHFFSKKHPEYDPAATDAKAESWSHGATLCETLARDCAPELKSLCSTCPHLGIIKSPISLGYPKVLLTESVRTVVSGQVVEVPIEVPALPPSMQHGYKWEGEKLWRSVYDKDASKETGQTTYKWEAFCETYFYPFSYYDDETLKHKMVWRLRERESVYREFVLSGGAMGAGGQALFKELGEQSIIAMVGGKNHMEAYIANFASDVKKRAPNTKTHTNFGWNGDDFLIGDTLIKRGGEHKKARLGGAAQSLMDKGYFTPSGTVERWTELAHALYGYEDQAQFQFILCTGFGSPLMRIMDCDGGTVISAVSAGSGIGKSTAGKLATGMYGNGRSGALTLTLAQATQKAVHAYAGTLNGIPIMVDEVTNIDAEVASDMIYTHSQGSGRVGLFNDGSLNLGRHSWSSIMNMSANCSVASLMQSAKPGADAEQARMIEFVIEDASKLSKEDADALLNELMNIRCVVGIRFMTWVQANIDEVKSRLKKVQVALDKRLNLSRRDRYWSYAISAVICGAMIAKELGLIKFDITKIIAWLDAKVTDLREEAKAITSTPAQLFSTMLTHLSQGMIVTDIEGDLRGKHPQTPTIIRDPKGPPTGRWIVSTGRMLLPQVMISKWCAEKQVSHRDLIKEMVKLGWILEKGAAQPKFPAKCTHIAMGQYRCYTVDTTKMESSSEVAPDFSNIVSIFKKEIA